MRVDHARRNQLHLTVFATLLALLGLEVSGSAATPQCLASFREIKYADGSARVRNYVCKTEGAAKPEIRVEFNRLSEYAAGSLIQGTPHPDVERTFGKVVRVARNAVAIEAKTIFDRFGTKWHTEHRCFGFLVSTAAGGQGYDAYGDCSEPRTLWTLNNGPMDMPLIADIKQFQSGSSWPDGYNFVYRDDCPSNPVNCTLLWRAARSEDLSSYAKSIIEYNRIVGLENAEDDQEESRLYKENHKQSLRYVDLMNHLTAGKWPNDFVIITGENGCGGIEFTLHPPMLNLDVAFIENLSDSALSVDALLGAEIGENELRKAGSAEDAAAAGRLPVNADQLQPGETVAIPLAITFGSEPFGNQSMSEAVFNRIRADKPGTVYESGDGEDETVVRKVRESFGPPKSLRATGLRLRS